MYEHFSGSECWLTHLEFAELIWMKLTRAGEGNKSGPNKTDVVVVADCHNRTLFSNLKSQSRHLVPFAPSWISDSSYIDPTGGIKSHILITIKNVGQGFQHGVRIHVFHWTEGNEHR